MDVQLRRYYRYGMKHAGLPTIIGNGHQVGKGPADRPPVKKRTRTIENLQKKGREKEEAEPDVHELRQPAREGALRFTYGPACKSQSDQEGALSC